MKTKRKRKSNNPEGRPNGGLTECSILINCPEALRDAVGVLAKEQGITASEAWRRAARMWVEFGKVCVRAKSAPAILRCYEQHLRLQR